jgi:hypothetical protein
MVGFSTFDLPVSVQAACLYDANREPAAQCATFSLAVSCSRCFGAQQRITSAVHYG